ncbi:MULTISPECIES: hypothetical protein [unclassified Micromonospora]|uniref:hypothetical protein n=1 Tax=unclassified Micromonospora TaxID=2617518 RepID=UPI0036361426
MDEVLRDLVRRNGGLVTRARATQVVPPWTLRYAYATGHLVRVLPEVFAATSLLSERAGRAAGPALGRLHPALGHRAVCAWAGGRAALSHLSALHVWGLHRQQTGDVLHLSAPVNPAIRTRPGVRVHRRQGFVVGAP